MEEASACIHDEYGEVVMPCLGNMLARYLGISMLSKGYIYGMRVAEEGKDRKGYEVNTLRRGLQVRGRESIEIFNEVSSRKLEESGKSGWIRALGETASNSCAVRTRCGAFCRVPRRWRRRRMSASRSWTLRFR